MTNAELFSILFAAEEFAIESRFPKIKRNFK